MDGGGGGDTYNVNLIGGRTNSLINVFDSGLASDGGDALTVTGTDFPDVFLLRAATADSGLAFVALINGPTPLTPAETDPYERINYNQNLESIVVNGGNGDDQFYMDDTRASITVNGDQGNDFFQIGQLFRSRRTPALAGVAPEDVFATIETTKGWLSNGISKPMTINGGVGNDNFIVFHNLDTLSLFGDAGNDNFLVQAFALAGSQEDHRALTDLSGGGGADLIQYAVDAPVNIDGGDGFDTVVVIGTEFNDDFVITSTGVFGAGLHVSFVNIEALTVDGGAGDDRFFVQSTGPTFTTEIDGGLGSDFISVEGPTPVNGVISNDLLGHSGIITHSVESSDGSYSGINVVGVSANVADDDTPGIVVTESNGGSMVVQAASGGPFSLSDHTADNFAVVLTRPPGTNTQVVVNVQPPEGLALLVGGVPFVDISNETQAVILQSVSGGSFTLTLGGQTTALLSWDASAAAVKNALGALSTVGGAANVVVTQTGTTYAITFVNGKAALNIDEMTATLVGATPGGTIKVQTTVNGGFSKAKSVQLTFDGSNWWIPQTVVFVVDERAEAIGTNAYFQNSAQVQCTVETPVPNCTKVITGTVTSGNSVDMNSHTVGDEYATLTASTPVFNDFRPTSSLPEGLRGAQLKISGNDPEAEGQIRLVLGSYLTHVRLGGATGGTFTLKLGPAGTATAGIAWNATAAAVKAAIELVLGDNTVDVKAVGGDFDVALRGTLYLTNDVQFIVNGAGLTGGSAVDRDRRLDDQGQLRLVGRARTGRGVRGQPLRRRQGAGGPGRDLPEDGEPRRRRRERRQHAGQPGRHEHHVERRHDRGAPLRRADERPRDRRARRPRRRPDQLQPDAGRRADHVARLQFLELEHLRDALCSRRRRRRHPRLPSRRPLRHRHALLLVPLDGAHRRQPLGRRPRRRVRRLDERDRAVRGRHHRRAGRGLHRQRARARLLLRRAHDAAHRRRARARHRAADAHLADRRHRLLCAAARRLHRRRLRRRGLGAELDAHVHERELERLPDRCTSARTRISVSTARTRRSSRRSSHSSTRSRGRSS